MKRNTMGRRRTSLVRLVSQSVDRLLREAIYWEHHWIYSVDIITFYTALHGLLMVKSVHNAETMLAGISCMTEKNSFYRRVANIQGFSECNALLESCIILYTLYSYLKAFRSSMCLVSFLIPMNSNCAVSEHSQTGAFRAKCTVHTWCWHLSASFVNCELWIENWTSIIYTLVKKTSKIHCCRHCSLMNINYNIG